MPTRASRFAGCLLGQCLGDALGFPIEGHAADTCKHYTYDIAATWFKGAEPLEDHWTGQYTDDSQLARELVVSLCECGGFDPADYSRRIVLLFQENRIVGRGMACNNAADRLIAGVPWNQSGEPPPSAGNGTAMRAGPIGLWYHQNPERMMQAAHEQGYITHRDCRCSAGSVAIAGAVALSLLDEVQDTEAFVRELSTWAASYDEGFAGHIRSLQQWISLPPYEAIDEIRDAGKPEGYIDDWPGISPFVIPSVLWSLYSFLRYRDSYWEAVSTAVSVGGDVDTTGAMTGAISGAYLGVEALPSHLVNKLHDKGYWTAVELRQLAERCYRAVASITTTP